MKSERDKLIYFAGFLDGDGHFRVTKSKNGQGREFQQCRIMASNTDQQIIDWLCKTFGGNYYTQPYPTPKYPTRKPLHIWNISGRKAEVLAEKLRPFLITRKEQSMCFLEKQPTSDLSGIEAVIN